MLTSLSSLNRLGQCCEDFGGHLAFDIRLADGRVRDDRLRKLTVLRLVEVVRKSSFFLFLSFCSLPLVLLSLLDQLCNAFTIGHGFVEYFGVRILLELQVDFVTECIVDLNDERSDDVHDDHSDEEKEEREVETAYELRQGLTPLIFNRFLELVNNVVPIVRDHHGDQRLAAVHIVVEVKNEIDTVASCCISQSPAFRVGHRAIPKPLTDDLELKLDEVIGENGGDKGRGQAIERLSHDFDISNILQVLDDIHEANHENACKNRVVGDEDKGVFIHRSPNYVRKSKSSANHLQNHFPFVARLDHEELFAIEVKLGDQIDEEQGICKLV